MGRRIAVIIGDGHGIDTDNKFSPVFTENVKVGDFSFKKGERFKENQFNKPTADSLEKQLRSRYIPVAQIAPEEVDVPLKERAARQNKLYERFLQQGFLPITISIHANAHGLGDEWTSANGLETFHRTNDEEGKRLALLIQQKVVAVRKRYPNYSRRSDRGVKTANFFVFREYRGLVILAESEFMTNRASLELLCSIQYQRETAKAYADALEEYQGFVNIGRLDPKTQKTV